LRFLEDRQLMVSAEKSSVTLFTPHTAEANVHPQIYVNGSAIPLVKRSKLLGVVHDTMYTFRPHGKYAVDRSRNRLNVLKALAGSSWGQQKETLVLSYKAICRSVAEYGVQIWGHLLSATGWQKLQVVQNDALRIATGCHQMSHIDHLHAETKVLPLRTHSEMLAKQYLLGCHRQGHACHDLVHAPEPPRRMKPLLVHTHRDAVAPLVTSNPLSVVDYKRGLEAIHTATVTLAKNSAAVNRVLDRPPPEIDKSEIQLSRGTRSTLSQLRSGFSKMLNNYQNRISGAPDICPAAGCGATPHDTKHLFSCPSHPSTLRPEDLWAHPAEVAQFLNLQ
jgi:hypothetical protein